MIDIQTFEVLNGKLNRRALNLVLDWAELHQGELLENWKLAREGRPLEDVSPLE